MTAARKYLVTSHIGQSDKNPSHVQVWNPSTPLTLGHPFQFVLEKTEGGARLRDLRSPLDQVQESAIKEISQQLLSNGKEVEFNQLKIKIKPCQDLPPAFQPSIQTNKANARLRVFTCVGNFIQSSSNLEGAFAARAQGNTIFSLQQKKAGFILKAKKELKITGDSNQPPQTLPPGKNLQFEDISKVQIHYDALTWQFHHVETPKFSHTVQKTEALEPEEAQYRKAVGAALGVLATIVLVMTLIPKPEPEVEEVIPPQFAKIILQKPKPKSEVTAPATDGGQPAVSKAKNTAVVQAFRAKALQSAVSGLLKGGLTTLLAQSDLVSGASAGKARAVFDNSKKGKQATATLTGLSKSRKVKVASSGGKAGKAGYGKGQRAGVSGQGQSFIALDTGGSSVDSGLSKDEVGKVIHSHMSEVRYCYESSMLQNPSIQGKLSVNFTIGPNGRVTSAQASQSTTKYPRLDDCVIRRLVKWKFPKPKGGVSVAVSYPFIFKKLGR